MPSTWCAFASSTSICFGFYTAVGSAKNQARFLQRTIPVEKQKGRAVSADDGEEKAVQLDIHVIYIVAILGPITPSHISLLPGSHRIFALGCGWLPCLSAKKIIELVHKWNLLYTNILLSLSRAYTCESDQFLSTNVCGLREIRWKRIATWWKPGFYVGVMGVEPCWSYWFVLHLFVWFVMVFNRCCLQQSLQVIQCKV